MFDQLCTILKPGPADYTVSGDALFGLARFKSHPTGLGVGFWPNW